MVTNELYINGKLTPMPVGFTVRLNRQVITPAELNTKDSQFSYSVELPSTHEVHAALGFANIEETRNKFNVEHRAAVVIGGITIFEGLLRLTSINKRGYRCNLYKPVPKSVADVFGDVVLAQLPELRINFTDFAQSISQYNNQAAIEPQAAIFPFALYGVLPKVPLNRNANSFSPRTTWDDSVYLGMQDLPPSLNLMTVLRHMFTSQGYTLEGTALDDERLARIYMSYKNASTYVQPWNYGYHAKMRLSGSWDALNNRRTGAFSPEKGVNTSYDPEGFAVYSVDMFDSVNSAISVQEDPGGNILYKEINDAAGRPWASCQLRIPATGFYKVEFEGGIRIDQRENEIFVDPQTGIEHISGRSSQASNNMYNNLYELKLLRSRGTGGFNLGASKIDGRFYYDNEPQNSTFDERNVPKHFPHVAPDGQVMMVDAAQNRNLVTGVHWGSRPSSTIAGTEVPFRNPRDTTYEASTPILMYAKPALSWNAQETTARTLLAARSPGYDKYGRLNTFSNDEDDPNANIDYSGGLYLTGVDLDEQGNPQPGDPDNIVLQRFFMNRYYDYRVTVPEDTAVELFVHNGEDVTPFMRIPFEGGVATFNTSGFPLLNFEPRLTLLVKTADWDNRGVMRIARSINNEESSLVGWESTSKYRMVLNNAPDAFARRGQFAGAPASPDWDGQGKTVAVVWLEAGELLTVASVTCEGRRRRTGLRSTYGMVNHIIDWSLSVQPYRVDPEWLKVTEQGNGTQAMTWNDPVNFDTDSINLMGFLSNDIRANEFIDNVVRAFNLRLSQSALNRFALDVKQSRRSISGRSLSLDGLASVADRENEPLDLPEIYRIGFTIDADEQGYKETGDDGGGEFDTGSITGSIVEQKTFFSYNWFKELDKAGTAIRVPIISKADVWETTMPYAEAMGKRYTDQPYRFWYYAGSLPGSYTFNGQNMNLAQVSNEIPGSSELSYKNRRHTILDNYFTLLIDASSHYTSVEAFLPAALYQALDGSLLVKFNGDLYYIAEITGYDPSGRNKTLLKLIRRI